MIGEIIYIRKVLEANGYLSRKLCLKLAITNDTKKKDVLRRMFKVTLTSILKPAIGPWLYETCFMFI